MKKLILALTIISATACTKDICQNCTTTITTTNNQGYYDKTTQNSYACNQDIKNLKDMDGTTHTYSGNITVTQTIKTSCK